ncbi:hypothetical protein EDD15DRAFT_2298815 [Pisolithus albus]|nr:hypothetical protein EDD15DRAFT_2298815 [Pisolithus albus]
MILKVRNSERSTGKCSHLYHIHWLLKWLVTPTSKQQCLMDRRPWFTAERKVNNNHTRNEVP